MRAGLMLALDVPDAHKALALAHACAPWVTMFKVGLELFVSEGPQLVRELTQIRPVFLDLKFHDIPNTVASAVRAAGRTGAALTNVHAAGGMAMMRAAAEAAEAFPKMRVIAVTVLTSEEGDVQQKVLARAQAAYEAGLAGVVCSAREAAAVRARFGKDFLIVTPGVRWEGTARDDQARTATPEQAVQAGADYLVVGRPILRASDPAAAARALAMRLQRA